MVGLDDLKKCANFDSCSVKNRWDCWMISPENGYCPYIQSKIELKDIVEKINYKAGQSCGHPGCCHHVTHTCERCGRTNGYFKEKF